MTVAMAVDNGAELVRCRGTLKDASLCGHAIACRWPNGVKAIVPDWIQETDSGKLRITCPVCGTSSRVPNRRSTA